MGLPAVEPPEPAVGHDDPVGDILFQGRDDARAGVLGRCVLVEGEVGTVQPAIPAIDERRGLAAGPGEQVVRASVVLAGGLVHLGLEAEQSEERLIQMAAGGFLSLVQQAGGSVAELRLDPLEGVGGILAPGRVFAEPREQEVVCEESPVAEIVLAEGRRLEDAAELVELLDAVARRPGEAADGPEGLGAGRLARDGQAPRHDLHPMGLDRAAGVAPELVEQHELQHVEIGGEDQQVIDVSPPQHAGQIVPALGREGAQVDEQNAEKAFGVFREHFDRLDRRGGLSGQPNGFRREGLAAAGVVAQRRQESRQGIGRGQPLEILRSQV